MIFYYGWFVFMKISSPSPSVSPITAMNQGTQTPVPHTAEIMQASSAVLTQATDTLNHRFDYSVQTTHKGIQNIQGLFNTLAANKASNPSVRVALVSGGSISGYATALKLRNRGFEVIVSEKRSAYTRENSFILKKEAFFSLANLSPDGSLLRSLLQEQLLDVHTTNIVKKDDARSPLDLVAKPNTAARFIAWFSNKQDLRAGALLVPKKVANHQAEAGHLDLAWPNQEPLQSVKAQDWRYDDLSSMGSENLGLAQFRNLEKGLNAHCVKQAGIHVLNAEVSVQKMQGDVPRYAPSFGVSDADQALQPQFPFDLYC